MHKWATAKREPLYSAQSTFMGFPLAASRIGLLSSIKMWMIMDLRFSFKTQEDLDGSESWGPDMILPCEQWRWEPSPRRKEAGGNTIRGTL